jgi:HipA-like C-terminal domain
VVERYDRLVSPDGTVVRIHQEDFCQALGISPESKYEEDGGPSLLRIARVLSAVAAPDSLERLLAAVTINTIVGNGDAHGKNFSLLHEASGVLLMTPLYDVLSTLYYGDDRLALYIDNVHRTNRVTPLGIANEAAGRPLRSGGRARHYLPCRLRASCPPPRRGARSATQSRAGIKVGHPTERS